MKTRWRKEGAKQLQFKDAAGAMEPQTHFRNHILQPGVRGLVLWSVPDRDPLKIQRI